MARTLTVKKGGGNDFSKGWKTVTISKAKYGEFSGTQFLDIWFEGYPDTFNARIYATKDPNGEEFAIGQVFRFANAGITSALEGPDGMVIKMDDDPQLLKGKQLNAYFHPDGDYTRVLKQFAPTVFSNEVETFQEKDIEYWKSSAEKYYNNYVLKDNSSDSMTAAVADSNNEDTTVSAENIPF